MRKWIYLIIPSNINAVKGIMSMKTTKNLTEGNIYKNLLFYAIPLILSSVLSQTYSLVDGVIAGKFISEHALGAVGATGSYEMLLRSAVDGFTAGFSIYVSHLFGKKDFGKLKRDTIGMSVIMIIISVFLTVLSIIFRNPIMDYLNVDDALRGDAAVYFVVYVMGYVFFFVNLLLIRVLHALGVTSFSIYVSLMSAVLNIGGNLLAVLVFDLGVAGLAISTIISSVAATVVYVITLRKAFGELDGKSNERGFDMGCFTRSWRYSVPATVQLLAFNGITFLIAPPINALGAAATTGYHIANRIYHIGTMSLWAATSAFACYTGQCVGEGNTNKIRRGIKVGFLINIALVLPFVLSIVAFAKPIVSLFFPDGHTGEAYSFALRYARVWLPFIYVQLVGHILHAYMRSLGRVNTVLWITVLGVTTRLCATIWLIPSMSLDGAFLGQVISWAIDAAVSVLICFYFYRTDEHLLRVIEGRGKKKMLSENNKS